MNASLSISPHGRLFVDRAAEGYDEAFALPIAKRVEQAFGRGLAQGLFHLSTAELQTNLPPAFEFARGFGRLYLTRLCQTQENGSESGPSPISPPRPEEFEAMAQAAPPLRGLEYLNGDLLRQWPVAERQAKAALMAKKLAKKGRQLAPVTVAGRAIATTFWGRAWCENLESYSDFSNRLPRGRTYVRNGLVLDLQINPGRTTALVSGTRLYEVCIDIGRLSAINWKRIRSECGGQIDTLVELLSGRLSKHVMAVVTRRAGGLFPVPREIAMSCSCPDWAGMCKHVAAALYGVGNRLDRQPELLFLLRQVDHHELIAEAGKPKPLPSARGKKRIAEERLAEVFGVELDAAIGKPRARQARAKEKTARRARIGRAK